ncbi:hypothetical protein EVAR_61226_1 [Eumeta japonica]|uniref:Uncharacterized protein n=1 Tax=Eumeta variegata TaxID=151549 RepID=A0A4C1Z8G7_EUMVA|nr:hypothetical protein EVAR_61226_1 [Eumeta japonica]
MEAAVFILVGLKPHVMYIALATMDRHSTFRCQSIWVTLCLLTAYGVTSMIEWAECKLQQHNAVGGGEARQPQRQCASTAKRPHTRILAELALHRRNTFLALF